MVGTLSKREVAFAAFVKDLAGRIWLIPREIVAARGAVVIDILFVRPSELPALSD